MGRRKGVHTAEFLIVAALGAAYVYFGGLGGMSAIFCGVSPPVIALIVHFCYRLAKLGMDAWLEWVITAGCCLVTIWPEAKETVLFVRPIFSDPLLRLVSSRRQDADFIARRRPAGPSAPQRPRMYQS